MRSDHLVQYKSLSLVLLFIVDCVFQRAVTRSIVRVCSRREQFMTRGTKRGEGKARGNSRSNCGPTQEATCSLSAPLFDTAHHHSISHHIAAQPIECPTLHTARNVPQCPGASHDDRRYCTSKHFVTDGAAPQPLHRPLHQPWHRPLHQPLYRPLINHDINHPLHQSIIATANHGIIHCISQPVHQPKHCN